MQYIRACRSSAIYGIPIYWRYTYKRVPADSCRENKKQELKTDQLFNCVRICKGSLVEKYNVIPDLSIYPMKAPLLHSGQINLKEKGKRTQICQIDSSFNPSTSFKAKFCSFCPPLKFSHLPPPH